MGIGSREGRQQCESEEEGECEETVTNHLTEATTSATEWMGVTTNSDDCSYRCRFIYCKINLLSSLPLHNLFSLNMFSVQNSKNPICIVRITKITENSGSIRFLGNLNYHHP